jgi:hypothetical protein
MNIENLFCGTYPPRQAIRDSQWTRNNDRKERKQNEEDAS